MTLSEELNGTSYSNLQDLLLAFHKFFFDKSLHRRFFKSNQTGDDSHP